MESLDVGIFMPEDLEALLLDMDSGDAHPLKSSACCDKVTAFFLLTAA
jgi:hypothetical protein